MKKYLIIALGFIFSGSVYAQDYQISFTGSGQSSTVDSVQVTNLAQGTTAALMGSDVLNLVGTVGLHEITLTDNQMRVYPNPMNESSTIEFYNPNKALTTILITDNVGKTLGKYSSILGKGVQAFSIQGLRSGCYQINIRNSKVIYNTSLISVGKARNILSLKYEGKVSDYGSENLFKRSKNLIQMQYNDGERLLFKALSSNYARILTLVPSESQIVDFGFIECTDSDDNTYPVVTIGDQTWMAENLKTTHYRNGDEIPNVTDNHQWCILTTGAYCWLVNDINWKDAFGAFYNWYTVDDSRGLCPAGWHTPSDAEWTILTDYLGDANLAGGKMKSTRTWPDAHPRWDTPNTGATNECGFSGLPCGIRSINGGGTFQLAGEQGSFWSSSENGSIYAMERGLSYFSSSVYRTYNYNQIGFSVRCLRD
jgi:uncharacterized protein (TIGR02145 family)